MKLAFTNVAFRHNPAHVIQKRLKLKRVAIKFRLADISPIFPNGSIIIQLLLMLWTQGSHFSNCLGTCPLWAISASFVYSDLLVKAFIRHNPTYYSKSSPLLPFCFLFICMTYPTQICPSPISLELSELFQGIKCNNEML